MPTWWRLGFNMRVIPQQLANHLNQTVTSVCYLLQIRTANGDIVGVTNHNQNINFLGLEYHANCGLELSTLVADAGLSVNNAEAKILTSDKITKQKALNGYLDDASWLLLLVNWANLELGYITLDAGDVGEVKVTNDVLITLELLSYSVRLKQSIGEVWQRDCRAIFGTPHASPKGCGVNASNLFKIGRVRKHDITNVYRVFTSTLQDTITNARLVWLSGDNASDRLHQCNITDGVVRLFEAVAFKIKTRDRFKIRQDCDKTPSACKAYNNFINYKGEPYIPVEDGNMIQQPGAQYRPNVHLIDQSDID